MQKRTFADNIMEKLHEPCFDNCTYCDLFKLISFLVTVYALSVMILTCIRIYFDVSPDTIAVSGPIIGIIIILWVHFTTTRVYQHMHKFIYRY